MNENIFSTIIRPLITEKGTHQSETRNAYAFEVDPRADKLKIKRAIEEIYDVKVLSVRTANRKGKPRRAGRRMGTTKHWKKAVVVLDKDHRIDLF